MSGELVKIPAAVTVTVLPSATVTLPTVAVAKVSVEFAVKTASLPDVQPVPPVGEAGSLQEVEVQVWPLVPSVLQ